MLSELDETIRQILVAEGGFDPAEVEISFDIPNRDWSAGISKPTLNIYLFDIHERRLLREDGWQIEGRGTTSAARRPPPLYFEMTYLITAWTRAVEDEHRLLWHVLQTMLRFPIMPEAYLQGALANYAWPIHTTVAQLEGVLKSPGEFWTALENQLKPSLSFVVTLALDRQASAAGPPVLSTGINVRLPEARAEDGFQISQIFALPEGAPLANITVLVAESSVRGLTDDVGRFRLAGLKPGRYLVSAEIGGQTYRRMIKIRDQSTENGRQRWSEIIRDQDGKPLSGVVVSVEGTNHRTTTDKAGRFAFDLLPGRYTLHVQMDGWSQRRPILVRQQGYTLTLEYGGVRAASEDATS